jgi:hypothetical protein
MRPIKPALLLAAVATSILALDSCRKEQKPRPLTGTVVDATTGEPIANATVYLTHPNPDCFSCPIGPASDVRTTGADGSFDFGFGEDGKALSGTLWVYAHNYVRLSSGVGANGYHDTKPAIVKLDPAGWLRLHIKNIPPMSLREIGFSSTEGFLGMPGF